MEETEGNFAGLFAGEGLGEPVGPLEHTSGPALSLWLLVKGWN